MATAFSAWDEGNTSCPCLEPYHTEFANGSIITTETMAKKRQVKRLSPSDLSEKYFGAGIVADIAIPDEEKLYIPTKSPVLNYQLGGGFMYGRIAEIAGYESSGKTLMAISAAAAAQELGGVAIIVDAEMAFSEIWAEKNGLDLDKTFIYPENTLENISDFVVESALAYRAELTNNEPILLIVDSIAALDTLEAMMTSELDSKAEMGIRAKALYKMLRLRNRLWHRLGITVIFINQLRDTISTGFGSQFKDSRATPGGRAMPFYATQRVYLEVKKTLTIGGKKNKRKVGVEVAVEMKKNKIAIPKATRRVKVIFHPDGGDIGWDKYDGLIDILIYEDVIVKEGGQYRFDDEELGSTKEDALEALIDDPELLGDACIEAGIMTVEEMQKRLDDTTDNLYEVTEDLFPKKGKGEDDDDE